VAPEIVGFINAPAPGDRKLHASRISRLTPAARLGCVSRIPHPATRIPHPAMHEDWTYDELREQGDELRTKINRFRQSMGRFFVKTQEQIDLMTVAAVAQEPRLLVGPPGTAKSDLILKFRDALGIGEA